MSAVPESADQLLTLPIAQIRRDGGTQPRGGINPSTAQKYAQMRREGRTPPAVVVFYDGENYWLGDGFHRIEGSLLAGVSDQPAEIRQGTQRDAIFYSLGANAYHGLALSDDDRHRAAVRLLLDEEWGKMSSRAIAQHVGFRSKTSVNNIRQQLREKGALGPMTEIVGTDGKTYPIPLPEPPTEEGEVVGEGNSEAPEAVALDPTVDPFPAGCVTVDARVAYAKTLSTTAELDRLVEFKDLQASARSRIMEYHYKLQRIEEASAEKFLVVAMERLSWSWPDNPLPAIEAAVLRRLATLADQPQTLDIEDDTDAGLIAHIRTLSREEEIRPHILEQGRSDAVRRAMLVQIRRLRNLAHDKPSADAPAGVLAAHARQEAEREAEAQAREAKRVWLRESVEMDREAALARIAETEDANRLASWYGDEAGGRVKDALFYAEGRDEVRRTLWARLVALGARPAETEECPSCPGCFAMPSYTGQQPTCLRCYRSPIRVRAELAQAAQKEGTAALLLTLADQVQAADDRQMHDALRRMIPTLAEHSSLALLCAGEEALTERLPDMDLHELRELYYLGRVGNPNRVLLRAVEEALAAAEAEAAAVHAPVVGAGDQGPGPGPMAQEEDADGLPALIRSRVHQGALGYWLCREKPEPEVFHSQLSHVEDVGDIEEALAVAWWLRLPLVYTDLLWARHAELGGEGGSAVAWPIEATAAGKVSVVELLAALDEAAGYGAPPEWLEKAGPVLASAMMAWMAHGRVRPLAVVPDAEAAK